MKISFIVCTYNAPPERLRRVVASIADQENVEIEAVELVIVDNRSEPPVRIDDLGRAGIPVRVVCEGKAGLTPARLRGLAESKGELLVYVDDDNILDESYAVMVLRYASNNPGIGVFSASIRGEFEVEPESWMNPYLPFLALTEIPEDRWSDRPDGGTMPVGAGMVVRREVMEEYARQLSGDPVRQALDRDGKRLLAGGDTDVGYAALSLGMGCGWCRDLKLRHLISRDRLAPDYLVRLVHDVSASHEFLARMHGVPNAGFFRRAKWRLAGLLGRCFGPQSEWGPRGARARGRLEGAKMFREVSTGLRAGAEDQADR